MTPWDFIVWSVSIGFGVGLGAVIAGFGIGIALLIINITRGKI